MQSSPQQPSKKTRTVMGQVVKAIVDRTRFKYYVPEIWFNKLFVTFQVPETEIVQDEKDGSSIITLDGFALYILDPVATSLEDMHRAYEKRQGLIAEKTIQQGKKE